MVVDGLTYAGERIFMQLYNIWGAAFGAGAGLSGVFGPVGTELCTILQTDFGEFTFHALG